MSPAGSETTSGRDEYKWLNANPFGRFAAEAPQGNGVDGKGTLKG